MSSQIERKLTTILAADAEGYSREMNVDEARAFDALHDAREVFSRFIARHKGRIANTAGDGLIADFPSVVEAVKCAIEVQQELGHHSGDASSGLRFRIGVHLGDVMVDGDDLLGEGVNLAARLQEMAKPGGIVISQQVYDQVRSKLAVGFEYLGERRPKNFPEDVSVYGVARDKSHFGGFFDRRGAHSIRTQQQPRHVPDDLRERVIRKAKLLGILWLAIVVVDVVSGPPFWAHWPGLVVALILSWRAAPLFARVGFGTAIIRAAAIVLLLAVVNLITWSGVLWVIWPVGALIAVEIVRRLRVRAD